MQRPIRFIDLFCGIGGFRIGFEKAAQNIGFQTNCVFSSDIDVPCQKSYFANFGQLPEGDIKDVVAKEIPDYDVLLAGFPCQSFSIIGKMKGFSDARGELFFDIVEILKATQPKAFILENVKQLAGHNKGQTIKIITKNLKEVGYNVDYKVLNALDFGLPQKRERVFIVGWKTNSKYAFPEPLNYYEPLSNILEKKVDEKHYASDYIKEKRKAKHKSAYKPGIWHENKAGNISSYPFSCALRAGASYNYLLVDGMRRLTPREMFRLQGFPDSYKIMVSDTQARKQAGNSVPVNVVEAVSSNLLELCFKTKMQTKKSKTVKLGLNE